MGQIDFSQRRNHLSVKNESKGHVPPGPWRYEIFCQGRSEWRGVCGGRVQGPEEGSRGRQGLTYHLRPGEVASRAPHLELVICSFSRDLDLRASEPGESTDPDLPPFPLSSVPLSSLPSPSSCLLSSSPPPRSPSCPPLSSSLLPPLLFAPWSLP